MNLWIAEMLRAQKRHISFHTPGHKHAGADITELPYSDNLYAPLGVIARAQEDAAEILGAAKSFFLTDGSTAGVFAMLDAAKAAGAKKIALPDCAHPSAFHAAEALGLSTELLPCPVQYGIPRQPREEMIEAALRKADALLLTSPDYYGFFPPLEAASRLCRAAHKPFLIDGAHGSHLHFTELHAGKYADLWVDGVHKSLPAMTQGAVVSAKTWEWGTVLERSVRKFRTTSPSYPILASVEFAVKFPRNEAIEQAAERFKRENGCLPNGDWTKLLVPFGEEADAAEDYLEAHGVYPEFNDGNYLMFYLSPCTRERELKKLQKLLRRLARGEVDADAPQGGIPIYREEP